MRDMRLPPLVVEAVAFLGRYAAWVGAWLQTFRYNLSVPPSKVEQPKNSSWLLGPWRWKRYVSPKLRYPTPNLRHAILQKSENFNM